MYYAPSVQKNKAPPMDFFSMKGATLLLLEYSEVVIPLPFSLRPAGPVPPMCGLCSVLCWF